MAAKWTADWINRIFILKSGVVEIDVQVDLYSDWKEEVKLVDNMKYAPAMRAVGGDPISVTQDLGATFFMINGWKIRPQEADHELLIVGNIYSDPNGESIVIPTIGTYTVLVTNRVSNLVDTSVSRLDLTQLLDGIYIDTTNGVSGTGAGVGTPTLPVNNITDARVIADRDNLRAYVIVGSDIILHQDHLNWSFMGKGPSEVDLGGFGVDGSQFESCHVSGTMLVSPGDNHFINCTLVDVVNIKGNVTTSVFEGTTVLSGDLTILASASNVAGTASQPIFDMNGGIVGAIDFSIRQWSGGFRLQNCVAGSNVSIDVVSGHANFDNNVTGGDIVLRGVGSLTDNSVGSIVNTDGFIEALDINVFNHDSAVYIDTNLPTSGTVLDWGTATKPVNNIVDAFTIAERENVTTFKFRGDLILDRNYSEYTFRGLGSEADNTVNFNGKTVNRALFENTEISGTMNGKIECVECEVESVIGFNGVLRGCGFKNGLQLADNADVVADNCYSHVPGTNTPTIDAGANVNLNLRHYSGGIKIENFTDGCVGTIDLDSGHVVIDDTSIGGIIVARGVGHITEQGGHGVALTTDGLVEGKDVSLSRKILSNKLITDPDTGILTIYNDDGSVLLTAQIFEDADGLQSYRGAGAERREKLS